MDEILSVFNAVIYTGYDETTYTIVDVIVAHLVAIAFPVGMLVTIVAKAHLQLSKREWRSYLLAAVMTGLILLYATAVALEYDNYQREFLDNREWRRVAMAVPIFGLFPAMFISWWFLRRKWRKEQLKTYGTAKQGLTDGAYAAVTMPIKLVRLTVPVIEKKLLLLAITCLFVLVIPALIFWICVALKLWSWALLSSPAVFIFLIVGIVPVIFIRKKFISMRMVDFSSGGITLRDADDSIEKQIFWQDVASIAWSISASLISFSIRGPKEVILTMRTNGMSSSPAQLQELERQFLNVISTLPGGVQREFDAIGYMREVPVWRPARDMPTTLRKS
jgi:hypothetical protein